MRTWTKKQEQYLIDNYPDKDTREIAKTLGKTYTAVKTKSTKLGLKKSNRAVWTKDKIEEFKKLYPHLPTIEVAKKLNVRVSQCYNLQAKLKIKKTEECTRKNQEKTNENLIESGKKFRFTKGHIPVNKGKPITTFISKDKLKNCQKTQFKKGHTPKNTKENGCISVRSNYKRKLSYKYIRISKGVWELLHRHIWEKHNGPIPEGCNIVFKNGNSMDCRIENLEMISNEKNMKRNTIHNYPPEIKSVIRLNKKLNKQIKEKENE